MNILRQILLHKAIQLRYRRIISWQKSIFAISLCLIYSKSIQALGPALPLVGVERLWKGGVSNHSCVLMMSGEAVCWGRNTEGQLGDGTTFNSSTPVTTKVPKNEVTTIALGQFHSCILTKNKKVQCWGKNDQGQLGDGSTNNSLIPVENSIMDAIDIGLGGVHTCAAIQNNQVKCWGKNDKGQTLGVGLPPPSNSIFPTDVNLTDVSLVTLGNAHSCALLSNLSEVWCWGLNSSGQTGRNDGVSIVSLSKTNNLDSGTSTIVSGWDHNCAMNGSGGIKCWGRNLEGQIGDNSTQTKYVPVDVSTFSTGAKTIALGGYHSCALTTSGGVKCWGSNQYGQLGDGTNNTEQLIPVNVVGFDQGGAQAIALGKNHSCVLTVEGGVKCWGDNSYGQLGNNTTTKSSTPVDVIALAEMEVQGNGVLISSGDTTPSLSDYTDFGTVQINTLSTQTFTIRNQGIGVLNLFASGSQIVCPGEITPTVIWDNRSVLPDDTYLLNIGLTPHSTMPKTCTVTIENNDPGRKPYTFTLAIRGSEKPILTVKVPSFTRFYGEPNPDLLPTYNGWVNGVEEEIDIPPTVTPSATSSSPPGVYEITCHGGEDNNYLIVCGQSGTLTIIEKPILTVDVPSLSRPYGTANPPFLPTYRGWISGIESIDISPTFTTTATPTSLPGNYPITCEDGGQDDHYIIVCGQSASTLTISSPPTQTMITQHHPNPSLNGTEITLEVKVRPLNLLPELPSGEVKIYQGTTLVCQTSLVNTLGTCTAPLYGMGPQTLSASYLGDAIFQESTSDQIDHFLLQTSYSSIPAPGETIDFGTGPLNLPLTTSLTIQETGSQGLKISLLDPLNDPSFQILTPFPIYIANGDAQFSLPLSCTPTSPGRHTATLKLSTNDPLQSTVTYSLTCEGQQPPGYRSFPPLGEFLGSGNVEIGQSIVFKMMIQESGRGDLHVDLVGLTGPQAQDFQILSPDFPFTIKDESETKQTVEVRCTPSALGKRKAVLTLNTNDPLHPTPRYLIECQGVSTPTAGYHSFPDHHNVLNFGTGRLNQSLELKLEMMETGDIPLTVEFKSLTGPQEQDFSILSPTFPLILPDGAPSQSVMLRCLPSAPGLRTAGLTFISNDPEHALVTYSLQCTGQELLSQLEITQIKLSNQTVAAHTPVDHLVGTFQTEVKNPSPAFRFVYRLLNDAQGTFKIVENQLFLAKPLTFEKPELYQIIVTSTEINTGVEKNGGFVIHVNAQNHAPTDIQLSHAQVGERTQGLVGTLTTSDSDEQDTHTYTLISGGQFVLQNETEIHIDQGITLKQPIYLVRVTSTDGGGLSVTKEFPIEVQSEAEFILEGKGESDDNFLTVKSKQSHLATDIVKVDESERVFLRGTFYPSRFHVGQRADLMFFYEWTPFGDTQPELKGSHIFAHQEQLETVVGPKQFFNFKVVDLEGTFKVGLGYQIGNQIWSDPAMLVVQVFPNRPPTDLKLDMKLNEPLTDKTPENTLIGILSMDDPDRYEEFTYRLLSGSGKEYVKIEKDRLLTGGWSFPLSEQGTQTYMITIQGRDLNGGTLERTFDLTVRNAVKEPHLTHASIVENSPAGTSVGRIFVYGNEEKTYQYQLVDDAQGHFALDSDLLVVHIPVDFEIQDHYDIIVKISRGNEHREKKFRIDVVDVKGL